MEKKIGEIFEYKGEWYQCIKQPEDFIGEVCKICAFQGTENCDIDECSDSFRSDKQDVIFKKLEKVGEPYEHYGKLYQCYKLPMEIEIRLLPNNCNPIGKDNLVEIEIKQNKEDMEENKTPLPKEDNSLTRVVYAYINGKISDNELINAIKEMSDEYPFEKNNLKPFSLEEAKQGKPVCTRDGRKARIIAFDRRLFYKNVSYPILALVERSDGEDDVCGYNEKGKVLIEDGAEYKDDLMMLSEKKEGWVNVYRTSINYECGKVFSTEQEAKNKTNDNRIATVRIEWEE